MSHLLPRVESAVRGRRLALEFISTLPANATCCTHRTSCQLRKHIKSAVFDVVQYTSLLLQLYSCSFVFIHFSTRSSCQKDLGCECNARSLVERCVVSQKRMLFPKIGNHVKLDGSERTPKQVQCTQQHHIWLISIGLVKTELFFFIFQGSKENNSKERVNWSWLQHRWRGEWGGDICVLHPGWCTSGPQRGTTEGRPDLVCRSSPCIPQGWPKR